VVTHNPIEYTTLGWEACHLDDINYHLENDTFGFAFLFIDDAWLARYFYFVPFFGDDIK